MYVGRSTFPTARAQYSEMSSSTSSSGSDDTPLIWARTRQALISNSLEPERAEMEGVHRWNYFSKGEDLETETSRSSTSCNDEALGGSVYQDESDDMSD